METLLQDIRYGLCMLRKNPGFTAVAAIALALGIASTTAIFSVVDVVLLHPLPYPDADRIVEVGETYRGIDSGDASPANYLDWASENHVFSQMAALRWWSGALTGGDRPERVPGAMVTASFFPLFGVNPILGRGLLPDDEKPGNEHVVVLSYGLWQRRFASDRSLVGRNITLNGERYAVIGVMPPQYSPDQDGELWLPSPWGVPTHPLAPDKDPRQFRDRSYLAVWGRLKPGVSLQQARAEMSAIGGRLAKQYPDSNDEVGVSAIPLREDMVGDIRPVLLVLLAAVGFVLLIGCANVANLLLARASARAKEISIRTALGASRRRLISQMLTESVLLALVGGILGIVLAAWAVPALLTLSPPDVRGFGSIGLNRDVLGFSLAVSVLSGILFGLAPAIQASHWNVNESLKEGERGSSGVHARTRSALVVSEVGLSLLLLVGAGLLVRSFERLMHVDPGFDPKRLLTFTVALPPTTEPQQQNVFYQEVVQQLQSAPGVQSAGAVSRLPLSGGNSTRSFTLVPKSQQSYFGDIRVITPEYFSTMGMPLLKGRNFTRADDASTTLVAIVNEALAQKAFPGQDPIGKYIYDFGPDNQQLQIVGVIGNIRHVSLADAPRPEVYQPLGQATWTSMFMVVRSKTDGPDALISAAQNAVWSVNRDVPLPNVRTMEEVIGRSVQRRTFAMLLLAIFAGLAMLLAAIGLYGVMSYSVSQRTREIGVRLALGAQRADVLRLVVGQGMTLVAAGVGLGIVAALALTRLMSGLLFGVSARDPLVFSLFAVLLITVALIASYVPARRAAKVDPMVALRYE